MKKLMTALASVTLVSSMAYAYEDPESRIGDRYPSLDQSSRTVTSRNIGGVYVPALGLARLDQPMSEDVEARVGDRYPRLEQTTPPFSAARVVNARVEGPAIVYYEDPESRLSDRYPQHPQFARVSSPRSSVVQRGSVKYVTARRSTRPSI